MVNYQEGNPMIPGNAELELHEVMAFQTGDSVIVTEAGTDYGNTCIDYAYLHGLGDASGLKDGVKTLMAQPGLTMETLHMGIPFMEAVQSAVIARITEMRLFRLQQGLAALSEFGSRPEVQAEVERQGREAFDNLASAVSALLPPKKRRLPY